MKTSSALRRFLSQKKIKNKTRSFSCRFSKDRNPGWKGLKRLWIRTWPGSSQVWTLSLVCTVLDLVGQDRDHTSLTSELWIYWNRDKSPRGEFWNSWTWTESQSRTPVQFWISETLTSNIIAEFWSSLNRPAVLFSWTFELQSRELVLLVLRLPLDPLL